MTKPCTCMVECLGQSGLRDGVVCATDNPGIHERLMQLPTGATCNDCRHGPRCFALGYSSPERTQCDFYPNRFESQTKKVAG